MNLPIIEVPQSIKTGPIKSTTLRKFSYRLDQIEELFGIGVWALRGAIAKRKLTAFKVGKYIIVKHTDLVRYIEQTPA